MGRGNCHGPARTLGRTASPLSIYWNFGSTCSATSSSLELSGQGEAQRHLLTAGVT